MHKNSSSWMLWAAAVFGLTLFSPFSASADGPGAEGDLAMAPQVRTTATFTFRHVVETSKPRLSLSDLAECQGMGTICEEAEAVDYGPSPEPGKTVTVMQEKLETLLAKEWPEAEFHLDGARIVKITSAFAELTEDEVTAALTAALNEQFGASEQFKVEIEKLTVNKGLKIRPGSYQLEFPALKGDLAANADWVVKTFAGSQRLVANVVFEDGSPSKEIGVQVTFALREKLPVLSRAMNKGDVISSEDVSEEWVEVGRSAAKLARDAKELVGRRLKRPAVAFRPVEVSQVEVPKIVKRGQLVKLVMKGKGLDVSSQVIAQGEGGYGQTLEAVYPATKKRLRVRVVDSSTVEYAF